LKGEIPYNTLLAALLVYPAVTASPSSY